MKEAHGSTSVQHLRSLCPGKLLALGSGPSWQGLEVELVERHDQAQSRLMPAVPEPQLVWIIDGQADFHEREVGGDWQFTRVGPGDLFLTTSPDPYESRWARTSHEPLRVLQVYLDLTLLLEAAHDLHGPHTGLPALQEVSCQKDATVVALLDELRRELTERAASAMFIHSLARALAVHLVRSYATPRQRPRGGLTAAQLFQAKQHLEAHLDAPLQLAHVAACVGLSPFHFSRSFKKATGTTLSHYLTQLRMQKARRLLRETGQTVLDISAQVGYSSQSHFAEVFRQQTGVTPSHYRHCN